MKNKVHHVEAFGCLVLLNPSFVGPIGAVEGFAFDNCAERKGSEAASRQSRLSFIA